MAEVIEQENNNNNNAEQGEVKTRKTVNKTLAWSIIYAELAIIGIAWIIAIFISYTIPNFRG